MTVSVQERPIEKIIASLLAKHQLVRIEFNVTAKIMNARAIPMRLHPLVTSKTQMALEQAARATGGAISLSEATHITEAMAKAPIAHAYGDTFQEVLKALGKELGALK